MGKTACDVGRERGADVVEYCDSRFLDACDIGLGIAERRGFGGDVTSGGSAGWLGLFDKGDDTAGGGEDDDDVGDMTAVILRQAENSPDEKWESWGLRDPSFADRAWPVCRPAALSGQDRLNTVGSYGCKSTATRKR